MNNVNNNYVNTLRIQQLLLLLLQLIWIRKPKRSNNNLIRWSKQLFVKIKRRLYLLLLFVIISLLLLSGNVYSWTHNNYYYHQQQPYYNVPKTINDGVQYPNNYHQQQRLKGTTISSYHAAATTTTTSTTLWLARIRNNNRNENQQQQQQRRPKSYGSISTEVPTVVLSNQNSFLSKNSYNNKNNNNNKQSKRWYPNIISTISNNIDHDDHDSILTELEQQSVLLATYIIRERLMYLRKRTEQQQQQHTLVEDVHYNNDDDDDVDKNDNDDDNVMITGGNNETELHSVEDDTKYNIFIENKINISDIVRGRFMDLTCTEDGEYILEELFYNNKESIITTIVNQLNETSTKELVSSMDWNYTDYIINIVRGAIMVLQSTCVMGTQVGVKGPPEQLRRMVEHLSDPIRTMLSTNDITPQQQLIIMDYNHWTKDSVRRLKYRIDRTPAIQLLAALKWKQTPQGAYDLLVALGIWDKHEDLALLRSGFPIRFTHQEVHIANQILNNVVDTTNNQVTDVDTILGIRQDLRHLKVYTIDGPDAAEIDDGISIERIDNNNRYRIWVHIADAERLAPPNSDLFEMARRRVTSLYLPHGSIPMFPTQISTDIMSLNTNDDDVRALSLGVELNDDGSINESSLILTPSLIKVSYRLTYDEVDEMLEEGIGYNEEWEIGALLMTATKRRSFRIRNGSSEGMVPNPVPSSSVSIYPDPTSPDGIGINISIEISHNAALNKTASAEQHHYYGTKQTSLENPASSAYLLVTEAMILAGEAIGVWKQVQDNEEKNNPSDYKNFLRLPFRTQNSPNFQGRSRERNVMLDLFESNAGMGWCHAWYTRRFLESVSVKELPMPHSGLGLNCYVQWSSPIRRLSDLQVHAALKRYMRRRKVYQLLQNDEKVPLQINAVDLGLSHDVFQNGLLLTKSIKSDDIDKDLNFMDGIGLVGAAKKLQRQSQSYWLLEFIRRSKETDPETTYNVVVLGCVDPERYQFAIYVKELGLEHRYLSPAGRLEPGAEFRVKVDSVTPRSDLLTFVRVI